MELIIQQIAQVFIKTITEKAFSEKIHDIDSLADELEDDCKAAAVQILEAVVEGLNRQIRDDKIMRKEQGLLLKEKERPREIYTKVGTIDVSRDYYFDKNRRKYVSVIDHIIGVRPYERIGDTVSAEMVNSAADVSYAKSARQVTHGRISRQSVRNHILKVSLPQEEIPEEKKVVKELHIHADEDHVHMQKPNKERGKKNQIVPLITVTEGTRKISERRNETLEAKRFVDKHIKADTLWETVEGYIESNYDTEKLEKIYVHGDGGPWIKNGLDSYRQTVHVMDGYHFGKRLRALSRAFPTRNVTVVLRRAVRENDKRKADMFLQSLMVEASEKERNKVSEFGTYLMGNWTEIYNLETLDIPGSCTEGQVSHVLSERFSRNPLGWSKEGLGKLSCIRVSNINGRKIEAEDFKTTGEEDRYAAYIENMFKGAFDWSIFDGEPPVFDRTSGTQILVDAFGKDHGVILS